MGDKLDRLKATLGNQVVKGDNTLRRRVRAKVAFRDVYPHDILKDEDISLNAEDMTTVKRLRAHFIQVMGRRRAALADSGVQLDVEAYIQQRVAGTPQPVFKSDGRQRGFRAMILLDRSTSMKGHPTRSAERACRIIQRALHFPFVDIEVWGFQSTMRGQVDIVRFHEEVSNFDSRKAAIGGVTPLSLAMQVVEKRLKQGHEQKHLFVITDGFPVYALKDGRHVPTKLLVEWAGKAVRDMRHSGVGVTGVVIGSELATKDMTGIFGSRRDWRRVTTGTFGVELVQLVTKSFVSYLRHG